MTLGIDVVKIERIERLRAKFGGDFEAKFLCKSERKMAKTAASLAGLWAAKEAISKALGCGISASFSFKDCTIFKSPQGAPQITFKKRIKKRFKIHSSTLTITHDGGLAIAAVAIFYKGGR